MTDCHVHVGWYTDGYHSPAEVWHAERHAGIDGIVVSSTSTCAEMYKLAVREMRELQRIGGDHVHPILWLSPKMMRSWGLKYMLRSKVRWQGVKMHWHAHREWFYNHRLTEKAMQVVRDLSVPLLLHTGDFKECEAQVFAPLISKYDDVTFILAHGYPLDQTIEVLSRYPNVYVDTAFMPAASVGRLVENGFTNRILFGTDAPINMVYHTDMSTVEFLQNNIASLVNIIGKDLFRRICANSLNLYP